jgi:hypothetical protein
VSQQTRTGARRSLRAHPPFWRMSPLLGAADRSAQIGVNLRARPMAAGAGGWLCGAGQVVVELAQRIGAA